MASQIKRVTSDSDVTTVGSFLKSVILDTDGTNAGSVLVRNGPNASGTVVASLRSPGAGPSAVWIAADGHGAYLDAGIGIDLTGTGATCTVEYEQAE